VRSLPLALALLGLACSEPPLIPATDSGPRMDAGRDSGPLIDARPPPIDVGPLDPDAACASEVAMAEVERLPVDIIWLVDNSSSMQPAIEQVQLGLNDFAALIAEDDFDYRVIMLSLRGVGEIELGGSRRFQVCIPPPLAGDASCGDGERFFHVSLDVRSTQPLEQFLGTLGQTSGYTESAARGSVPWRDLLRDDATKTIVVVSDDNARMVVRSGGGFAAGPNNGIMGDPVATADWFETAEGPDNPFNSNSLPDGILHASWGGLFEDYTFHALYGWASATDPLIECTYEAGGTPDSAGPTYTELVRRTGGTRAQICDGPDAWGPFFDAVATAIERTSRIDCTLAIPEPPEGSFFDADRINVWVDAGDGSARVGHVTDAGSCDDERGGWYYDDEDEPTSVILCPTTCEDVQAAPGETRSVEVQFGCQTIPI
jgi:hypothetical protein